MENKSFKLLNIFLLESFFKREAQLVFDKENISNNFQIDIKKSINGNILYVFLTVIFQTQSDEILLIDAKITMVGAFEFQPNKQLQVEDFAAINAPAIIFPFIREHLSNLSVKAGLQPIMIHPINFVALAKQNKSKT